MKEGCSSSWDHPSFLVDWLLESTIHVILCQGIHCGFLELWGSTACMEQIQRLEYHPGFPMGNKLRCPAFSGDKWGYLIACSKYCLPSFKVLLNISDRVHRQNMSEAKAFMFEHELGFGFILKAGYVQNKVCFPMRHIKTIDELSATVLKLHTNATTTAKIGMTPSKMFDYVILQPRVQNREKEDPNAPKLYKKNKKTKKLVKVSLSQPPKETKVVLLNGEATYICSTTKNGITGLHTEAEIFSFVEAAAKELSRNSHGAFLMDGLSRVDVFSVNGKLCVNEFENLDAQFSKLGGGEMENKLRFYLQGYYASKISEQLKLL